MATLSKEQLANLSPEHRALIGATCASYLSISDALSIACASGHFFEKRTEVKDRIISACADGLIQADKCTRTDWDINKDSFYEWLERFRPVVHMHEPERPSVDLSCLPVIFAVGAVIWFCWALISPFL